MAINLPGDLSQSWQNLNTFSSQVVNQVTEASQKAKVSLTNSANTAVNAISKSTTQAVDTLSQTTDKAKAALSETANTAVDAISKSTNRAVDNLSQTTDKAKGVLSETANQAVNTITANTEQAKASLEASIKKAEGVSGKVSEALQTAISSLISDWINAHPKLFWLVSHPFLSLAILFLTILIMSGLLKALGRFFEQGWLRVLQAPVKLSKFIAGSVYKFINSLFGRNNLVSEQAKIKPVDLKCLSSQSVAQKERLTEIISRLNTINQEHNKLMQEAVAILNSDEVSVN